MIDIIKTLKNKETLEYGKISVKLRVLSCALMTDVYTMSLKENAKKTHQTENIKY